MTLIPSQNMTPKTQNCMTETDFANINSITEDYSEYFDDGNHYIELPEEPSLCDKSPLDIDLSMYEDDNDDL